jgi:hypothetical protein
VRIPLIPASDSAVVPAACSGHPGHLRKPLERVIGKQRCMSFMFMFSTVFDGKTISAYKHYNTRKYLFIDTEGNFYAYNGKGENNDYTEIEQQKALQYVNL